MTKVIREYKKVINTLLNDKNSSTDWQKLSGEMLEKIKFFQHERLVHLIVTMTVAIVTVMSVLVIIVTKDTSIELLILTGLLIILLAPYMFYYFLLENAVQDMYKYYDRVLKKKDEVD